MGFFGNLVSGPLNAAKNLVKGAVQTLVSPFTAAFSALKTVGNVALDLVTFNWGKIPGHVVNGTMDTVKNLGEGPLNMLRGTVGLGATVGGTAAGMALGPLGGAAGYSAGANFSAWIN
jgi:hypothetical protein